MAFVGKGGCRKSQAEQARPYYLHDFDSNPIGPLYIKDRHLKEKAGQLRRTVLLVDTLVDTLVYSHFPLKSFG